MDFIVSARIAAGLSEKSVIRGVLSSGRSLENRGRRMKNGIVPTWNCGSCVSTPRIGAHGKRPARYPHAVVPVFLPQKAQKARNKEPLRGGTGVLSQKYLTILPTIHPASRRCLRSPNLRRSPALWRLASRATRRPNSGNLFLGQNTRRHPGNDHLHRRAGAAENRGSLRPTEVPIRVLS